MHRQKNTGEGPEMLIRKINLHVCQSGTVLRNIFARSARSLQSSSDVAQQAEKDTGK